MKNEVIGMVWQYYKFYGNQLSECETLYKEEHYHSAIILLFNINEVMYKSILEKYDLSFIKVLKILYENGTISSEEHEFLSTDKNSIRQLRNHLAHANLTAINLEFESEQGILYPLEEETTFKKLYEAISEDIFVLIYKIVCSMNYLSVDLKHDLKIPYIIKKFTSSELLEMKGFDREAIDNFKNSDVNESTKLRLADNSSDVKVLSSIFKEMFKE